MNPENVLLVGVKGAVLAFRRDTGAHLWATELKSSSNNFVTVISDEDRVYAHTGGELFCLDLQSGTKLWADGLKGFGYGLASIALPGVAQSFPTVEQLRQMEADASSSATDTSASSHH
jgi:hypothetical protein